MSSHRTVAQITARIAQVERDMIRCDANIDFHQRQIQLTAADRDNLSKERKLLQSELRGAQSLVGMSQGLGGGNLVDVDVSDDSDEEDEGVSSKKPRKQHDPKHMFIKPELATKEIRAELRLLPKYRMCDRGEWFYCSENVRQILHFAKGTYNKNKKRPYLTPTTPTESSQERTYLRVKYGLRRSLSFIPRLQLNAAYGFLTADDIAKDEAEEDPADMIHPNRKTI